MVMLTKEVNEQKEVYLKLKLEKRGRRSYHEPCIVRKNSFYLSRNLFIIKRKLKTVIHIHTYTHTVVVGRLAIII